MADMTQRADKNVTGWVGWVFFAGLLMLMQGLFQAIEGLVAIFRNTVLLSTSSQVWVFDFTTWGWIHLIIGVVLVLTSFNLFRGGLWGISVGIFVTILSAIANFAYLPIYPLWSAVILVMNVLVLYALVAHGTELRQENV